jgi:hypothetical protein
MITKKKIMGIITGLSLALMIQPATAALFTQDFSSSTNVASYASATPSQNQFTFLPNTGALGTASITDGTYQFVKTATNNTGVTRTVDMVGSPAAAMKFSFDLAISGFTSPALTRLITGTFGSSASFSAYGIDSNGDGTWRFAGNPALTFNGTQTVTFFLNDSAEAIHYTAPDSTTETLGAGKWEIWVGTVQVTDEAVGTSANDLSRFNINLQNAVVGQTTTFVLDNFNAEAIPEPATVGMMGLGALATVLLRRLSR